VLIFIHELGHFLLAKAFGIKVTKFSLGFGPKLFGKQIGETEYVVSMLPLGGYVKMHGENQFGAQVEEEPERSFANRSVGVRALVVAAGPFFNFALAVLIFAGIYTAGIGVPMAKIGTVIEKSAAQIADLRVGDVIKSVDSRNIEGWDDLVAVIVQSKGSPLTLLVSRNDTRGQEILIEKVVKPTAQEGKNIFGEIVTVFKLGIAPAEETIVKSYNPIVALGKGVIKVVDITKLTLLSVFKMVQGTISPSESLGGPLAIAQMAGAQAKAGLLSFLLLMAFLSVNLGIINLFPIPALDGGHLTFYLIEAIFGKPLSPRVMELAQKAGFILLIALMMFVIFLDINRF